MITKEQIEHLAGLAYLDINDAEKKKYAEQISSILDYFNQLNELDTDEVEPLAQVFEAKNILRPDVEAKPFSEDKTLAEAPELEQRQIKVPMVLK
ncbi:Asp-tRNA(Asn)/Glu-tRNA(Gln) amidotransferase subunit GatC [Candidatus Falkowbacteria bacterium]|nr:Asp-tRNA(Asn)/Glu-tRNA(Gln) amidotransferase subunit GatC [Candidatus Falkowbacteria bacterium]